MPVLEFKGVDDVVVRQVKKVQTAVRARHAEVVEFLQDELRWNGADFVPELEDILLQEGVPEDWLESADTAEALGDIEHFLQEAESVMKHGFSPRDQVVPRRWSSLFLCAQTNLGEETFGAKEGPDVTKDGGWQPTSKDKALDVGNDHSLCLRKERRRRQNDR